jgi:hypothetical protein
LPFESLNTEAYRLLLRIEVALRELLSEELERTLGPSWQKRLPGDLLKKIRQAQLEENRPQYDFLRLGPLYYLTLGELHQVLTRSESRNILRMLGGDWVLTTLESLLPLRNAVGHSRSASCLGLKHIQCAYEQFEKAIGKDRMERLLANPTIGISPEDARHILRSLLLACASAMQRLSAIEIDVGACKTIQAQYWWSDSSLAGFDTGSVDKALYLIEEYLRIPAGLGCAALRSSLANSRDGTNHLMLALNDLNLSKES